MTEVGASSISAALRPWAARDPDCAALTEIVLAGALRHERTVTRGELERSTNRLARHMLAAGVGDDDLVTIGLPNGIAFYETAIAAWKCGATPQPISYRLPERERATIIELAEPALVVIEPIGPDPDLADDALPDDPIASSWKAPTSGGSTGVPKIILSGAPATANPDREGPFGMGLDGVHLVPGPLYHNAPFVFSTQALWTGNHIVVLSRFDAATALDCIERYGVNWMLLVPTMMQRIWRLPEDVRDRCDLSSLRALLHLAASCPPWLKQCWIDWLGPERVWELYAGTEAQGMTVISGTDWLEHVGSVGKPADGTMRILDADGNDVPSRSVGEIWMKSPAQATYRYVGAEARARDGWESLGDLGSMDADGFLYIADRRTDLILSGGANVYPAEVEAALDEHPDVRSCAVIGLPDDDLGKRVHAIVEVDGDVTDDELRAHMEARLVRHKVPRSFERADGPVRDDAGKVRRSGLAADRGVGSKGSLSDSANKGELLGEP
jgi:bile acid-coenzyme A ligase